MFVKDKVSPPGVNPLRKDDRMPVVKVISGDSWHIEAHLVAADGGPASPENSFVEFVLSENQFSPPLWTGTWFAGILPDKNRRGLVHVEIPREKTKAMRRGSYMFSMRVADRLKYSFSTQLVGNFLVEYMPTSDQHSIPYRDGTSDIFGNGQTGQSDPTTPESQTQQKTMRVRDPETGLYHSVVAVKEPKTGEVNLGVVQEGTIQ